MENKCTIGSALLRASPREQALQGPRADRAQPLSVPPLLQVRHEAPPLSLSAATIHLPLAGSYQDAPSDLLLRVATFLNPWELAGFRALSRSHFDLVSNDKASSDFLEIHGELRTLFQRAADARALNEYARLRVHEIQRSLSVMGPYGTRILVITGAIAANTGCMYFSAADIERLLAASAVSSILALALVGHFIAGLRADAIDARKRNQCIRDLEASDLAHFTSRIELANALEEGCALTRAFRETAGSQTRAMVAAESSSRRPNIAREPTEQMEDCDPREGESRPSERVAVRWHGCTAPRP